MPSQIMALFGSQFRRGGTVLLILGVGQAIIVFAGSVGTLLMMSGHEKKVRNSNLLAALACVGAAGVLVPRLGAIGAAISVSGSLILRTIMRSLW